MENKREIADLRNQIQKLQRMVYSLVGLVVAVGVLSSFPVNAFLQAPAAIQTSELQIVDENGAVVAILGREENGGILKLKNKAGGDIFVANADSLNNGKFGVRSADGREKFSGFVSIHGNGELKLRQVDNSLLAVLGTVSNSNSSLDGRPSFSLRHPSGRTAFSVRSSLSSLGGDISGLSTFDATGRESTRLSTTASGGHGYLLLRNAKGSTSHFIGSESNGSPVVDLRNGDGTTIVRAEQDSTSGSGVLKTRDDKGNPIWQSGGGENGSGGDGTKTSGLPGDLDNDGDVDFADFLTFAINFGKTLAG
ncbi:MAG: hypothetical protein ACI8V2_000596 [Candidatus Latescibacterota bacterium]|jgi:hypothetical protein